MTWVKRAGIGAAIAVASIAAGSAIATAGLWLLIVALNIREALR